jgi:hypothetical protein
VPAASLHPSDPGAGRAAGDAAWLRSPWGDALLRFIADPASDLDPASVPGWPDWAGLDAALASPAIRMRLGRCLVADRPGAVAEMLAVFTAAHRRLLLIPANLATSLVTRAAAWIHAPRLRGLLQREAVDAARAALGRDSFAFALGGAGLLPRPGLGLEALLLRLAPVADAAGGEWRQAGEVTFGLAVGPVPLCISARLRLRTPVAVWTGVAANCRDDPEGPAAFAALVRLIREAAPRWSSWFS